MKINPLFDRVVILPDENVSMTKSGIVLPQTAQERPQTGKIVAVGSGYDLENHDVGMVVDIDDKVLYNKYSGVEVKIDKVTYLVLRQIDIIGIIEE